MPSSVSNICEELDRAVLGEIEQNSLLLYAILHRSKECVKKLLDFYPAPTSDKRITASVCVVNVAYSPVRLPARVHVRTFARVVVPAAGMAVEWVRWFSYMLMTCTCPAPDRVRGFCVVGGPGRVSMAAERTPRVPVVLPGPPCVVDQPREPRDGGAVRPPLQDLQPPN